jgi:hypothetical protein
MVASLLEQRLCKYSYTRPCLRASRPVASKTCMSNPPQGLLMLPGLGTRPHHPPWKRDGLSIQRKRGWLNSTALVFTVSHSRMEILLCFHPLIRSLRDFVSRIITPIVERKKLGQNKEGPQVTHRPATKSTLFWVPGIEPRTLHVPGKCSV